MNGCQEAGEALGSQHLAHSLAAGAAATSDLAVPCMPVRNVTCLLSTAGELLRRAGCAQDVLLQAVYGSGSKHGGLCVPHDGSLLMCMAETWAACDVVRGMACWLLQAAVHHAACDCSWQSAGAMCTLPCTQRPAVLRQRLLPGGMGRMASSHFSCMVASRGQSHT